MPYECPRADNPCRRLHTGCIGHARSGAPCAAQVMRGTDPRPRCRSHLGVAPEIVKAKADADRLALTLMRQAEDAARRHGVPNDDEIDVLGELLKVAGEALRWKGICSQLLAQLEEVRYRAGAGEQTRAEIVLYTQAIDRAARILIDIAKLNIEERRTRLNERDADLLMREMDRLLVDLGLDPDAPAVATVVAKFFSSLAAEQ